MSVVYNPFDPDQVDHHDELLARLRHDAPVVEIMPGMFYVTRHEEILEVCRHPEVYRQGRFQPLDLTQVPDYAL